MQEFRWAAVDGNGDDDGRHLKKNVFYSSIHYAKRKKDTLLSITSEFQKFLILINMNTLTEIQLSCALYLSFSPVSRMKRGYDTKKPIQVKSPRFFSSLESNLLQLKLFSNTHNLYWKENKTSKCTFTRKFIDDHCGHVFQQQGTKDFLACQSVYECQQF